MLNAPRSRQSHVGICFGPSNVHSSLNAQPFCLTKNLMRARQRVYPDNFSMPLIGTAAGLLCFVATHFTIGDGEARGGVDDRRRNASSTHGFEIASVTSGVDEQREVEEIAEPTTSASARRAHGSSCTTASKSASGSSRRREVRHKVSCFANNPRLPLSARQ